MATPTQTVDDPWNTGWAQPAFDPRILSLPLLMPGATGGANIQRGFIKQANPNTQASGSASITQGTGFVQPPRMLQFLYNPSSVSVSHQVSTTDAAIDPSLRSAVDDGTVVGQTGATCSFSLLFDRTYEVSDSANFGQQLGELGVAVDINALYALTGILQLTQSSTTNSVSTPVLTPNQSKADAVAQQYLTTASAGAGYGVGGFIPFTIQEIIAGSVTEPGYTTAENKDLNNSLLSGLTKKLQSAGYTIADLPPSDNPKATTTPANPPGYPFAANPLLGPAAFGYMLVEPVIVVFGQQRGTWNPTVQYYGYIDSMNITYAHWTQSMVPVRAAVDIEMTLFATTVDAMTQMANNSVPGSS